MQPHLNMQPGKAFLLFFGCFYTIVVLNQSCYTPRFAMADIYLSMSPQTSQAAQKLSEIAAELTVCAAHSEVWAEQVQSALCAAEALCKDLSRDDVETGSFRKVSSRCSAIGSPPDDGLLELERLQVTETIDTLLRGLHELERRTAGSQWLEGTCRRECCHDVHDMQRTKHTFGAELEENNGWASSAQADLLALHNIFQQPGCCLSGAACDAVRAALKAVARRLSEALAASPRFVTCKLVDKSSA
eukprot:s3070_g11.t2